MGSQITRHLNRGNREAPYRGTAQSATKLVRGMGLVMSTIMMGCAAFLTNPSHLHPPTSLIWLTLLVLALNITNTSVLMLLLSVGLAVISVLMGNSGGLLECVLLGLWLTTASNIYTYYDRWIWVMYLVGVRVVSSVLAELSIQLREGRQVATGMDAGEAHLLIVRICLSLLCGGCGMMVIGGHKFARRFRVESLSLVQFTAHLKQKATRYYSELLLVPALWVVLSTKPIWLSLWHVPFLLISSLLLYLSSTLHPLTSKLLHPMACVLAFISWNVQIPIVTHFLFTFVGLSFLHKIALICEERPSLGIALIILADKWSTNLLGYTNVGFLYVILSSIGYLYLKKHSRSYESIPFQ